MPDLSQLTLKQITGALRKGDYSSRELAQAYLDRIELLEPQLNAFISIEPENVLEQADKADHQLAAWRKNAATNLQPLLGVPIAIKDVLCVSGLRCTAGSRILENFKPVYDATAAARLIAAGALVLGKTNTDEFAMGSSTENSAYGVTRNPWDPNRVPGGSSGGSAAAVAANMAPVALGTDTGGSVRLPASYCGVTGIKPTYGRVSRYGLIAFGSSLDVVGVLGQDVEDVSWIFNLIAGHDPLDSTSVDTPVPQFSFNQPPETILNSLRIGVPQEYFISGMQLEVEARVKEAINIMQDHGALIETISLPHTEYSVPVYYLIAPAEASANLARYDGIRYGPRVDADSIQAINSQTRGEKFGPEVKRRIMLGTYALSAGYYDAYYGQAQKVRTLIKNDFERAFEKVDIIAAPVAPSTAFKIGEHSDDPLSMYLEDIFTIPANLAGIPGLTIPAGLDQSRLPVGIQLMGAPFNEDLLFKVGNAFQAITQHHLEKPIEKTSR